jgi:hypothetical protein
MDQQQIICSQQLIQLTAAYLIQQSFSIFLEQLISSNLNLLSLNCATFVRAIHLSQALPFI